MFKAEELGWRNRNCWYSTSESKGREWDLVSSWHQFLAWNIIAWILARTHFWQKSFKASRRVGRRQFQINVLAPSGTGLSLQPWVSFWRLSLLRHSLISFPEAAILLVSDGADQKDRGPLGTRLVAVPPKASLMRTKAIPPGESRW